MDVNYLEITDVTNQKKSTDRVNIFVNGSFYGSVFIDVCLKYGITKGAKFSEDRLNEIILLSDKEIALNKTAKYISAKLKTIKEVKDYLYSKQYSKVVVDYVIAKLTEYKYLDDEAYVNSYVNTYKNKYGAIKLKNNLIQKGISKDYLEKFFDDYIDNSENILELSKKYLKNKEITYDNIAKLYRHLLSKGYSYDDVSDTINKIKDSKDESWDWYSGMRQTKQGI